VALCCAEGKERTRGGGIGGFRQHFDQGYFEAESESIGLGPGDHARREHQLDLDRRWAFQLDQQRGVPRPVVRQDEIEREALPDDFMTDLVDALTASEARLGVRRARRRTDAFERFLAAYPGALQI
jgi:hypothetical protein